MRWTVVPEVAEENSLLFTAISLQLNPTSAVLRWKVVFDCRAALKYKRAPGAPLYDLPNFV